jgi:hypothetical protein
MLRTAKDCKTHYMKHAHHPDVIGLRECCRYVYGISDPRVGPSDCVSIAKFDYMSSHRKPRYAKARNNDQTARVVWLNFQTAGGIATSNSPIVGHRSLPARSADTCAPTGKL